MKLAIGADHRGVRYKKLIEEHLKSVGHPYVDFGTNTEESVDFPDLAVPVARSVAKGEAERGILICSSGIGMSIAANRFKGVRATLCMNERMAEAARSHNNSNLLCLGQDLIDEQTCLRIVDKWLATEFDGGRHSRRLGKIEKSAECEP